jgi:hypothetical protein
MSHIQKRFQIHKEVLSFQNMKQNNLFFSIDETKLFIISFNIDLSFKQLIK